jgi:hypothetical protein
MEYDVFQKMKKSLHQVTYDEDIQNQNQYNQNLVINNHDESK